MPNDLCSCRNPWRLVRRKVDNLLVILKWFIFAVKQPWLSSVESVPFHPGCKAFRFIIMEAIFRCIFVHREQSGQKKGWRCLISCTQLCLLEHRQVHWWSGASELGQFPVGVTGHVHLWGWCGCDGAWRCCSQRAWRKFHADPQLISSIRDNCFAWCPCPRHVDCCGAIGIPPRFLLANNLHIKFFQQTADFQSIWITQSNVKTEIKIHAKKCKPHKNRTDHGSQNPFYSERWDRSQSRLFHWIGNHQ